MCLKRLVMFVASLSVIGYAFADFNPRSECIWQADFDRDNSIGNSEDTFNENMQKCRDTRYNSEIECDYTFSMAVGFIDARAAYNAGVCAASTFAGPGGLAACLAEASVEYAFEMSMAVAYHQYCTSGIVPAYIDCTTRESDNHSARVRKIRETHASRIAHCNTLPESVD